MVIDDFNVVLYSHERSFSNLVVGNTDKAFGDLVIDIGLVVIGFLGPQFI